MSAQYCLPREICKWLQSLDLSFNVKNPKRDISNGYLVAEIMTRYFPKDVNILNYENGTRLAAKVDNWEQLCRIFSKQFSAQAMLHPITKEDIDPVIHCATGHAEAFIFKLYSSLTKRKLKLIEPKAKDDDIKPFMRDTASKRMKDPEIARVQDNVERTIRAIDSLGAYHDERRYYKAQEAPTLMMYERHTKMRQPGDNQGTLGRDDLQESLQIDEVTVKAMTGAPGRVGGGRGRADSGSAPGGQERNGRARLLQSVCKPRTSVGALASLQQPALFVKPAADIMRPLVSSVIQDHEELSKVIDSKKDVVVAFMEQCRQGVPEEIAVKVFEILANRAQLLVDTLVKSAPEFWRVWSTFSPALSDFSEASPVFESVVFLFKSLGEKMREQDAPLTQQLITEVGLPSLARELARSPEKRECLCEIIYSYTQEDTLNHLLVLRSLKDIVHDLPVYVSCLACLIHVDAELGLLDEHLLDLYIYYAMIAMQSSQPKIRVAGISIVSTITLCSSQHQSILSLVPAMNGLAADDWWEVQAQLLLLAALLLGKLTLRSGQDAGFDYNEEDTDIDRSPSQGVTPQGGGRPEPGEGDMDPSESLLNIINRIFVISNSKNVLQVGLSALAHLLADFSVLLPVFVTVLLGQSPDFRQRLLRPQETEASNRRIRLTYVTGNSSRMYEENCISSLWPHLDVAKTFVRQLIGRDHEEARIERFDIEHVEVFLASLPEDFEPNEANEWIEVFDRVRQYVFVALVDPKLHIHSTQIIKRFWFCSLEHVSTRCLEVAKNPLLKALSFLYSEVDRSKVSEAAMHQFLRECREQGGNLRLEIDSIVEAFKVEFPSEYASSQLDSIYM